MMNAASESDAFCFLPETNHQAQLLGSMFSGPDFWKDCIVHLEQIRLALLSLCLTFLHSYPLSYSMHTHTHTWTCLTIRDPSIDIHNVFLFVCLFVCLFLN